jgi:hypothetical protein
MPGSAREPLYNTFAGWVGGINPGTKIITADHPSNPYEPGTLYTWIPDCTFALRLTCIHIPGSPVIIHGARQLLSDMPSLQPHLGILWLPGCQSPADAQTGEGTVPTMP